MPPLSQPIDLHAYRSIVVLTGAGISVASGLRPYRGPDGLWNDPGTARYSEAETLLTDPQGLWQVWGRMRQRLLAAEPNAAHRALAAAEARLQPEQRFTLVTQNIDGLHLEAGSRQVVEYHGNVRRTRCMSERCLMPPFADAESPTGPELPRCSSCGAMLRPDIVLFGEAIPGEAHWRVGQALQDCDLFLAVGTSGTVFPAAGFARTAHYAGARTILVNLEPMIPPDPCFEEEYLGPAEELLPTLLAG